MNDLFLRQYVNTVIGMTLFSQKTGVSTVVPSSTWTKLDVSDLSPLGISAPTTKHLKIKAYKVTTDVTDLVVRVTVNDAKIWPFTASTEVLSGVDMHLSDKIQVPLNSSVAVEVFSATGGNATMDYLSVIEIGDYSHE